MANVLIVSAHPDDEAIGAGGSLFKHMKKGDSIFWLITTHMNESVGFSTVQIKKRNQEVAKVAKILAMKKVFHLPIPTMTLSDEVLNNYVPQIGKIISEVKPEVIYLPNRSDAHTDHQLTFQMVISNTKTFRHPYLKKVLMYECLSETEFAPALSEKVFLPNFYVDISKEFKSKEKLLLIYASEMGQHPFPRSIRNVEALATLRGATAGVEYAEAFQIIRWIDK